MGATVVFGDFEWDEEKAASNLLKHGVSFEEAAAIFLDVNALVGTSDDYGEVRIEILGRALGGVLFVVAIERGARDRIISAREATRFELKRYEEEPK
jgi:uncharacterized protein